MRSRSNGPPGASRIRKNTIESDLYGSYPFSSPEAGAGILVQSSWGFLSLGFYVEIEYNVIKLRKLNHCGIKTLGAVIDREGTGKLKDGLITNNHITLTKGYEGIHLRRCDDFEVTGNTVMGDAYYAIRISGRDGTTENDMRSYRNNVEDNHMDRFTVRASDDYCLNHADGDMFPEVRGDPVTAHVWLGRHSKNNTVKLGDGLSVLDEGELNTVITES